MKAINCPDLSNNKFVSIYVNFKNIPYKLTFKWNEYCDCCFLSIFDTDGKEINTGNSLTCRTVVHTDKRKVPNLFFTHKDDLPYEPTPETMKDYRIFYED